MVVVVPTMVNDEEGVGPAACHTMTMSLWTWPPSKHRRLTQTQVALPHGCSSCDDENAESSQHSKHRLDA